MKKNGRIYKRLLCIFSIILAIGMFSACGKKDKPVISGSTDDTLLTRAEYIGMLGEAFGYGNYITEEDIFSDVTNDNPYYANIQASAEWGVISASTSFEPNKAATVNFALESAVRAIGLDDIALSGSKIDESDLTGFYTSTIAKINATDDAISRDVAKQVIGYAKQYANNLTYPQTTEMEFCEGVKTAASDIRLNVDGETGVIAKGSDYKVGDIVYFDATDKSLARAIKITGIDGTKITFQEAAVEEAYKSLTVVGSFKGKVVEATAASEASTVGLSQEIYDEMKNYGLSSQGEHYIIPTANTVTSDVTGDHIIFNASFDVQESTHSDSGSKVDTSLNGSLTVGLENIWVDVQYESGWLIINPKKVECKVHYNSVIYSNIHGNVSATIPLGEAYIQVWGPLNIKIMLTAHIGADGNISISYVADNTLTVGWQKKCGLQRNYDSNSDGEFNVDATLTAEATLLVDLRLGWKKFSYSLVNAQVTSGVVARATIESDLMGDLPTCADIRIYVPLRWGINLQKCLITDISDKLKYEGVIWDSTNSPIQLHRHFEDWKRTEGDVCTRTDTVEQDIVTPEGEPLEEIDPFDFEPIEFDFIELTSYVMYVGEGESMNIGFASIPEGYSKEKLVYEVEDGSVCFVENGQVTAKKPGSTTIKISTEDGQLSVSIAVTVNEDYTVDGFQEL